MSGDTGRDREQSVAQAFRFPPACLMAGVCKESSPRKYIAGKSDQSTSDPVVIEIVEGEVRQARVFRVADTVFTAGSSTVTQFEVL